MDRLKAAQDEKKIKEREQAELPAGQGVPDNGNSLKIGDRVVTSAKKKKKDELDGKSGTVEKISKDLKYAHVRLLDGPKAQQVQKFTVSCLQLCPSKRDADGPAHEAKKAKGEAAAKALFGDLSDGL